MQNCNLKDKAKLIELALRILSLINSWLDSWKFSRFIKLLSLLTIFLSFVFLYGIITKMNESSKSQLELLKSATREVLTSDRQDANKADSLVYSLSSDAELNVNQELDRVRTELNADRADIAIFSDTEKQSSGLHFRYFSYCYEKPCYDRGVSEIADEYQRIKTSLYPIYSYLSKNKEFYGPISEYHKLDKRYSNRMDDDDCGWEGKYFMRTIDGREIGVLSVSWSRDDSHYMPDTSIIKEKVREHGTMLESLLDPNYYKK